MPKRKTEPEAYGPKAVGRALNGGRLVRGTPEQWAAWDAHCQRHGVTWQTWVASLLDGAVQDDGPKMRRKPAKE